MSACGCQKCQESQFMPECNSTYLLVTLLSFVVSQPSPYIYFKYVLQLGKEAAMGYS